MQSVTVVAGASSEIGRAVASAFAETEYSVIGIYYPSHGYRV